MGHFLQFMWVTGLYHRKPDNAVYISKNGDCEVSGTFKASLALLDLVCMGTYQLNITSI